MSLSGDSLILLRDLRSVGLAVNATYNPKVGSPLTCIAAVEIQGIEESEELPGQVQRTIASITISMDEVEDVQYESNITISTGKWAGKYVIYGWQNDDDSWILDTRTDVGTRARSADVRRLAGS